MIVDILIFDTFSITRIMKVNDFTTTNCAKVFSPKIGWCSFHFQFNTLLIYNHIMLLMRRFRHKVGKWKFRNVHKKCCWTFYVNICICSCLTGFYAVVYHGLWNGSVNLKFSNYSIYCSKQDYSINILTLIIFSVFITGCCH